MWIAGVSTGRVGLFCVVACVLVFCALIVVGTSACDKGKSAAVTKPGAPVLPLTAASAASAHGPGVGPASSSPSDMPSDGPQYRCDEPVYEFPDTWAGDMVEHTWVVHNDGHAVLEIPMVQPACSCTVAEYDKVVQPGGQGRITAKFNTRGYNNDAVKVINVRTNDPRVPETSLRLMGRLRARISLDPPSGIQWGYGPFPPNVPLVRTIKLTSNVDKPLKLERGPQPLQSAFTYEIKEVTPGKQYELTVTADRSQLKEGANSAQISLRTGLPEEPDSAIPVNLYFPPVVQVMPPTLTLATPVTGPLRREITLTYNGGGPMKITGVSASDPGIKVRAHEMPPPQAVTSQPASGQAPLDPSPTKVAGASWKIFVEFENGWDPSQTPQTAPPQTQPGVMPQPPIMITALTDVKEKPKVDIRLYTHAQTVFAESLVGKPAPACMIKDINGKDIRLGAQSGNVVVTAFWTSWCPHCKRMLPLLQKTAELYADKGVVINLINMDTATPIDKIKEIVSGLNVRLPFALDATGMSGKKYGANRFPMTFVVGKTGTIETVNKGCPDSFEQTLNRQIDLVLAGKTVPPS